MQTLLSFLALQTPIVEWETDSRWSTRANCRRVGRYQVQVESYHETKTWRLVMMNMVRRQSVLRRIQECSSEKLLCSGLFLKLHGNIELISIPWRSPAIVTAAVGFGSGSRHGESRLEKDSTYRYRSVRMLPFMQGVLQLAGYRNGLTRCYLIVLAPAAGALEQRSFEM